MFPTGLREICGDSPLLRAFLDGLAAAVDPARGLPDKRRLDVARLGRQRVLPHVWILERGADGVFRYRLAGEEIVRNFGTSPRGKTLDEALGPGATATYGGVYAAVLDERKICHVTGAARRGGLKFYHGERLLVPMCDGPGPPALVICCFERREFDPTAEVETGLSFDVGEIVDFPLAASGAAEVTATP